MNAVASPSAAASTTDRIERSVHIAAPRSRVWRALSDAEQFGAWFGCDLKGQKFEPGKPARGRFTIEGHSHMELDIVIDRVEPETLMSYRWHPYAVDPKADYSKEEPTLVTFTLADAPDGGTMLKVVESGFDKIPAGRRPEAIQRNTGGWEWQLGRVKDYAQAH